MAVSGTASGAADAGEASRGRSRRRGCRRAPAGATRTAPELGLGVDLRAHQPDRPGTIGPLGQGHLGVLAGAQLGPGRPRRPGPPVRSRRRGRCGTRAWSPPLAHVAGRTLRSSTRPPTGAQPQVIRASRVRRSRGAAAWALAVARAARAWKRRCVDGFLGEHALVVEVLDPGGLVCGLLGLHLGLRGQRRLLGDLGASSASSSFATSVWPFDPRSPTSARTARHAVAGRRRRRPRPLRAAPGRRRR